MAAATTPNHKFQFMAAQRLFCTNTKIILALQLVLEFSREAGELQGQAEQILWL